MPYDDKLADRVRERLARLRDVKEKKMFRGLVFMVNGKMCINISGDRLMCRYDPALQDEVAERSGFHEMKMGGRKYKGFCYVSEEGFRKPQEFEYWITLCLDFNKQAKASKPKKKK